MIEDSFSGKVRRGKLLGRLATLAIAAAAAGHAPAASDVSSPDRIAAGCVSAIQLRDIGHTVTFDVQGLRFRPRQGPAWQWRFTRAVSETGPVDGVIASPITPCSPEPGNVVYDRGAIRERYLQRRRGIEQRFEIPRALNLAGADLIVEGSITTSGTLAAGDPGWTWGAGPGSVSPGDVFVFDANGDEIDAELTVSAGTTRIIVNGAALMTAAYPVIIDPEIGTNDLRISDLGRRVPGG